MYLTATEESKTLESTTEALTDTIGTQKSVDKLFSRVRLFLRANEYHSSRWLVASAELVECGRWRSRLHSSRKDPEQSRLDDLSTLSFVGSILGNHHQRSEQVPSSDTLAFAPHWESSSILYLRFRLDDRDRRFSPTNWSPHATGPSRTPGCIFSALLFAFGTNWEHSLDWIISSFSRLTSTQDWVPWGIHSRYIWYFYSHFLYQATRSRRSRLRYTCSGISSWRRFNTNACSSRARRTGSLS